MKVLLAHNYFYIRGGAEVFFREVGRVLEERGHQVAYFSGQDAQNLLSRYESYFPSAPDYQQGNLVRRIAAFGGMVYSRNSKKNMLRLLKDFRPDIVHVFAVHIRLSPSILDACREYGVPVVMSCNDSKHMCPNYRLFHHGRLCEECKGGRFYRASVNRCCKDSLVFSVASSLEAYVHGAMDIYRKNIRLFLFASEFMARKTEEFWGADTFSWRMLRNPFDSRSHTCKAQTGDFLIYFGRLTEEKGLNVLIEAMQHLRHARLKIIGDGPMRTELEARVKTLSLDNVEFLGPKWGEDLDDILCRARFVVVPSIGHENFPYVILQSFAAGKAVIGADRGGIPELVRDGEFGLVYPAQDPAALARCISTLWDDPGKSETMGKAAKAWADKEYTDESFYENIMGIYREVAG